MDVIYEIHGKRNLVYYDVNQKLFYTKLFVAVLCSTFSNDIINWIGFAVTKIQKYLHIVDKRYQKRKNHILFGYFIVFRWFHISIIKLFCF